MKKTKYVIFKIAEIESRCNMKEFVEKLIGRLEERSAWHQRYGDTRGYTFAGYEGAIEIVNQLAEEYNNGWIPCSERLPEKYGEYLCCDTYGNFVLGFPSESDTSDTGFIVETEHEYCYDIIAWMELPEKYKEKKNGSS